MNWLEIQFWKFAKRLIIRGYGCRCKPEDYTQGCAECEARKVVEWIDKHIELLED